MTRLTSFIFSFILLALSTSNAHALVNDEVKVDGELKQWHKVTLLVGGPTCTETGTPNPFLDYKLTGVFTQGDLSYTVPGYFAADGDAANTSAGSGNVWRIHFTPPTTGTWNYTIRLRSGSNVAIDDNIEAGTAVTPLDNTSGTFDISATDKTGRDLRGKGRLEYIGEHHLRFAGNGEWFIKAGSDSPENFLAYEDFDGNFKSDGEKDNLVKSWAPHLTDWSEGDPSWGNGKGKEIIGAVNYLSSRGMNVFSFLTMNINGDDRNVFPYITSGNHKQIDCSKMDQWEVLFEHAQEKGMYLHFKTQEVENETLLDNGNVGTERKLYYRELIARFGHHLALNWNLGEENQASFAEGTRVLQNHTQRVAMAKYFHDTDPYKNNIVIHTAPSDHDKIYTPMLGSASELTGVSIQTDWTNVHNATTTWVNNSRNAGKKWVVANDEQGSANTGVPDDAAGMVDGIRKNVLWGNLMAGGAGVEYYFGYETLGTDLDCQDYRSREMSWRSAANGLLFFNRYVPFWSMKPDDSKANPGWCLYNDDVYVVYLQNGGTSAVTLGAGTFNVFWYNPKTGGDLIEGKKGISGTASISAPNSSQDWAAVIYNTNYTHTCNAMCTDDLDVVEVSIDPAYAMLDKAGDTQQLTAVIFPSNAADKTVSWSSDDEAVATVSETGLVTAVGDGKAKITATTTEGNKTATIGVSVGDVGGTITYGENFVVFEAEATSSDLGLWVMRTPDDPKYKKGTRTDASGTVVGPINDTYLEFTGNNEDGGAATSPLVYKFTAPKTATYQLTMRVLQNLEGAAWDKCNDVYVKMDGNFTSGSTASMDILTSNTKLYGRGKDNWGSMVQLDNHDKYGARYNFIKGEEYILTISGRAQRTCIDYILFFETSLGLKFGEEVDVCTQNPEKYRPSIMECSEIKAVDFDKWTDIDGFTNAATDNKDGKDILQIGTRDAWAAAQYIYSGPNMSAYFKINAMQESDGESTYKLRVNGELLGEGTNDRILNTAILDYTIQQHEINTTPFYLQDGDVIQVEFNNATNGLVPEGNLTATSRGRWYSLEICTDNVERIPAEAVEIDPQTLELSKNNTYALMANFTPAKTYNQNVTWLSTNNDVATVDADGVVSGIANGSAQIIVTSIDGGFKDTCNITVLTKAVTGISVNPTTLEIIEGQSASIKTVFAPLDASNKNISWMSDSVQYVTVDANGNVTAKGPGSAHVIVTTEDGSFKDTCLVTVPNIKFYNLNPVQDAYTENAAGFNNTELKCEGTKRLSYLMFDLSSVTENIHNAELTLSVGGDAGNGTVAVYLGEHSNWSETAFSKSAAPATGTQVGSLNGTFAKGNSYKWQLNASAIKGGGKVTFVITQAGGSDVWFASKETSNKPVLKLTCPNEPGNAAVEGITLDCPAPVAIGTPYTLTATVLPSDAKNKTVSWTSSNTDVATIDDNGTLNGLTAGTTTITVKTEEGDFEKSCEVSVYDPTVQTPYSGTAALIPGIIEAEHYDFGGEGVAYHDADAGNTGGEVRTDDVDIEARDGGYNVGWTAEGEWMEYTVDVQEGVYNIEVRTSGITEGRTLKVSIGDSSAIIDMPTTSDWPVFETTAFTDIKLAKATNQILRIEFPQPGTNVNWLKFKRLRSLGIGSVNADISLMVYPNPVNGSTFTIEMDKSDSPVEIKIMDIQGRAVFMQSTSNQKMELSADIFPMSGVYIIQASSKAGIQMQKLIVR